MATKDPRDLLGEDLFVQVKRRIGNNEIAIIGPDSPMVPKRRLDEVIAERNRYRDLAAEHEKQLVELKARAQHDEALQVQIADLQTKNKQAAEEHEKQLREERFAFAVEQAIVAAGARNVKAVMALMDTSKIAPIGDGLYGLDAQIAALKESDPYLFGVELKGRTPEGTGKSQQAQENPWKKETFNLTKQGEVLRKDPNLAIRLKAEAGVK